MKIQPRVTAITDNLYNKGFLYNVLLLIGGTATSQLLIVVASPIITRLYRPDDFGVFATYLSILTLLGVISSLRYDAAIPIPKSERIAARLTILSLFLVILFSFLVLIILLVLERYIKGEINLYISYKYLYMLPISLLGMGIYKILSSWAIRKKNFTIITKTKIQQSCYQVATQIFIGFFLKGPLGLLVGDAFGRMGGSVSIIKYAWKIDAKLFSNWSFKKVIKVALRYRDFPFISTASSLFNQAGLQIPQILLVAFYSPQIAGWYILVQRVLGMPMNMIGQSVAQVYLSECSRMVREGNLFDLKRLYVKTAKKLLFIGIIPIITLSLVGSYIFQLVFGHGWEEAGNYAEILSFMFLFQFIVSPLSQTLNVLEKQGWQLIWDIMRFSVICIIFAVSWGLGLTANVALFLYAIIMTLSYVILFYMTLIALNRKRRVQDEK